MLRKGNQELPQIKNPLLGAKFQPRSRAPLKKSPLTISPSLLLNQSSQPVTSLLPVIKTSPVRKRAVKCKKTLTVSLK